MIIALKGEAGHGKDTVANLIKEIDPSFESKAFADKLKIIAKELTSIPLEDFYNNKEKHIYSVNMSVREFLQKLGSTIRTIKDDIFISALFSEMIVSKNYIITDVRFKSELEKIFEIRNTDLDKVVIIKVFRPEYSHPSLVGDLSKHSSETELADDTSEDFVIINDGTLDELKKKVKSLMSKVKKSYE